MFPPVAMSCVYGICAFVLRCFFFCSQTVLQMEHSLGVKKFFSSSLSSCKKLYFLNTLSPVLSTPLSYVCCVCMDRLMANFAGTCTSDNKGLLLLLLLVCFLFIAICINMAKGKFIHCLQFSQRGSCLVNYEVL